MKTVEQRLDRLEDRLAPQGKKPFLIVVTDAEQKLALDNDRSSRFCAKPGASIQRA